MRMKLKSMRVSLGITQKQIAQQLGISVRFYQHIEAGARKGSIELWDKIEDIFNVPQRLLRADTPTNLL